MFGMGRTGSEYISGLKKKNQTITMHETAVSEEKV